MKISLKFKLINKIDIAEFLLWNEGRENRFSQSYIYIYMINILCNFLWCNFYAAAKIEPLHFSLTHVIYIVQNICRRTRKEFNDYFKSAAATTVFKKVEYRIFSRLIKILIFIFLLVDIYLQGTSNVYYGTFKTK